MKKHIIVLFALLLCSSPIFSRKVKTGIEVLKSQDFKILQGKRVGLITNPTGVDNNLRSDIDLLASASNVNLVALFGPEHGVRGSVHAGASVSNDTDPLTGIPVYSLYGKNRKPSKEMLKGIDVLVYDIQDVGCRSFTYISTLYNVMMAAAENNIKLVVLDRPNPLGGKKIEGNIVEDDYISFVSQIKIPYVYGMTPGELALMINGENMLGKKCDLEVVKMKGWKRKMTYKDTGLPWVLPSPHIPTPQSSVFYSVTGIVGELTNISIGVGYTLPFEMFGAPWIDANKLSQRLNALNLPGVVFRPVYYSPFYGNFKGEECKGVQIYITDYNKVRLCDIQFCFLQELYQLYPEHDILAQASGNRKSMVDKVCGSNMIRTLFLKRHQWKDVQPYWDKDVQSFRKKSSKYYLYR